MRRCAIYTRKSTEEGLEQNFNSLDAQREACAAYVQSQKGAGWRLHRARYDDGGLSGATMERPALRRLLQAVEGGQVDIVVVYKVDRLSRSLTDFTKMVETFDANGVSFVSVTHAVKAGRRYRYYISKRLMHDRHKHTDGWRLPAQELEALVQKLLADALAQSQRKRLNSGDEPPAERDGSEQILSNGALEERRALIHEAIQRIDLSPTELCLTLRASVLDQQAGETRDATAGLSLRHVTVPIDLRRRGVERKIVIQNGSNRRAEPDPVLCRLIGRAQCWVRQLARGEAPSVRAMDIVETILEGRQPPDLTARALMRLQILPANWQAQRRRLGFPTQS
jgi:hypothetical protein